MEGLSLGFGGDLAIYVVLAVLIGILTLLGGVILLREARDAYRRWDGRTIGRDEGALLAYMTDGNPALLRELRPSRALRDRIVKLSAQVEGEAHNQLVTAYTALGFTYDDFRLLRSRGVTAKSRALQRCRLLQIPLPDAHWDALLRQGHQALRWAAMEYLITIKGARCVLTFLSFIRLPANRNRGMVLHLSCCMAKVAPSLIFELLTHVENDFLKEAWLHTLSIYPMHGSEALMRNFVEEVRGTKLLPMALRAAVASPSDGALLLLRSYASYPDGNVRALVAELLASYAEDSATAALAQLALDADFAVRSNAVESLAQLGAAGVTELIAIDASPDHPSYLLLQRSAEIMARIA